MSNYNCEYILIHTRQTHTHEITSFVHALTWHAWCFDRRVQDELAFYLLLRRYLFLYSARGSCKQSIVSIYKSVHAYKSFCAQSR